MKQYVFSDNKLSLSFNFAWMVTVLFTNTTAISKAVKIALLSMYLLYIRSVVIYLIKPISTAKVLYLISSKL